MTPARQQFVDKIKEIENQYSFHYEQRDFLVYKETQKFLDQLEERIKVLEESVMWLLPMAESWTWEHPIDTNKAIVVKAKAALAAGKDKQE